MPSLPEVTQKFVADTTGYSRRVREAANDADKFSKGNDRAALAARRMGLAAKEAAERAARAQKDAANAAEKLARGELSVDEAANAAAKAERELERASIKAAEAQMAAGKAADSAAKNFKQVARDAELAAAAEHLGALKASGSIKQHNSELRKLESRFGDLSKEASGAFKMIESEGSKAFQLLDSGASNLANGFMGPLVFGGIIAAIHVLPAAASMAAGGITLALGGALASMGIKAQMANRDVQQSFAGTKSFIVSQVKQISTPFHDTLLNISKDARTAFTSIEPSLTGAFAKMAPAITRFSHNFSLALSRLNPVISSIGSSFAKVLDTLGPAMPQILGNIGNGIKSITDAAASNPGAITGLITDISSLVNVMGKSTAFLVRNKQQFDDWLTVFGGIGGLMPGLIRKFGDGGSAGDAFGTSIANIADQANQAANAQRNAAAAADALTRASLAGFDAETRFAQALADASARAKQTNAGINLNTAAGRQNRVMLGNLAVAYKGVADNSNLSAGALNKMRDKFIAVAHGMGLSDKAAADLANQLGLTKQAIAAVPKAHTTQLKLDAANFFSALHKAQGTKIDPKTGLLKGNNSDYLNKWLKANGLRINPKTGLLKGDNADYYNKWFKANGLKISTKTGRITGNTSAFWSAVNSIPQTVGYRRIGVYYVPLNSANQPGTTRANGGIDRYADGGVRRDLQPFIATQPTVLFGETETGGEAYIPLGQSKRARSVDLLGQVADMFGLALVKPMMDGAIEKYAKGKVSIGKLEQKQIARLHAAQARVDHAKARPEYLAAMAAQQALASMRSSVYGGIFRGGRSTPGSAHGSVVQHTTNLHVTVQGNVWETTKLAQELQGVFLRNGMPVNLPAGR